MTSTVKRVRDTRNAEQRRPSLRVSPVQDRETPARATTPHLNTGETRSSYAIDPEPTVTSVVCVMVLASLSIGLVVGLGIGRSLGVWR